MSVSMRSLNSDDLAMGMSRLHYGEFMSGSESETRTALGLPVRIEACLFDMDGVLTQTSDLHRSAWKSTFDPILAARGLRDFNDADYATYVDGRPRADGVRSFLKSRGISLPEGGESDAPGLDTISAIGRRKNDEVVRRLREDGVSAYPGSLTYVAKARAAGLRTAAVTASANGLTVLESAGLAELLDARVDGVFAAEHNLAGKPAPDTFLAAARLLDVDASQAAVFEDAIAGVEAGRSGEFGFVVGVNRLDQADKLRAAGADRVVDDLAELLGGQQ